MLNAQFGYADGYGGKPLPFFKNFYAGGVDSVRAFETATLGPRDTNGDVLGGNKRFVTNLEFGVRSDERFEMPDCTRGFAAGREGQPE